MTPPPPRHWVIGALLSFAVAWASGAALLDTLQPVRLDLATGRYMPEPGTVMRYRSEGFARTTAGEHGLRSLPGGVIPSGPKVVFWGDSYVEALQVDDEAHMDRVFSRLAKQESLLLNSVAVGVSGDSILDSHFRLRQYAQILFPVGLHVFVVAKVTDILPDISRPGHSEFWTKPEFRLVYGTAIYGSWHLRLGTFARWLELAGPYRPVRKALSLRLRLLPGPEVGSDQSGLLPDSRGLEAAWAYLLTALRSQAPEPMLILYLPTVPSLRGGEIVHTHAEETLLRAFAATCRNRGIWFRDMGPDFIAHFRSTGRFPRGFFNSPPGSGHLNEDGHRLVAQAVLRYIQDHPDALLAR